MATIALAVALLSAALHATWNFFLKGSGDRLATAVVMVILGSLMYLPWIYAVEGLPVGVWDHVAASAAIHSVYFIALVSAYDRVDFSVAYPMARGVAPALVAFGGWLFLGDQIAAPAIVAIGVIVVALVWLGWNPGAMSGLPWALLTGLMIAMYTVNDAAAVRESGKALSYTVTITAASLVLLLPFMAWRRGGDTIVQTIRARPIALFGAAALNIGAYALVLWAATRAPVGLVAAVRESSVVIGALAGVYILKEPHARRRLTGAAIVGAGIIVLGVI